MGLSLDDLAVRDRELEAVGVASGRFWVGQHIAELGQRPSHHGISSGKERPGNASAHACAS
jgi:hypothetical protein